MRVTSTRSATTDDSSLLRLVDHTRHISICLVLRDGFSLGQNRPRYAVIFDMNSLFAIANIVPCDPLRERSYTGFDVGQ